MKNLEETIEILDDDDQKDVELLEKSDTPEEKKESHKEKHQSKKNKYISFEKRITFHALVILFFALIIIGSIYGYILVKEEKISYVENSLVSYQVCLDENNYYLESCLHEDMEYISELVKNIRVDFNYNAVYPKNKKAESENKPSHKQYYMVKGIITVRNAEETKKILYKQERDLVKEKENNSYGEVVSFSESIEIPFKEEYNYIENYLNNYSLITDANYHISFIVKDKEKEQEVGYIDIPLAKQTFSVEKNQISNKVSEKKIPSKNPLKYSFIGLILISSLIIIIYAIDLFLLLYKVYKSRSKYERKLKEILVNYDRVIITGKKKNQVVEKENIYEVNSFLELLDVRDTIDKPILYYKINSVKSEFYVQDNDTTYKYTMKESDFVEK